MGAFWTIVCISENTEDRERVNSGAKPLGKNFSQPMTIAGAQSPRFTPSNTPNTPNTPPGISLKLQDGTKLPGLYICDTLKERKDRYGKMSLEQIRNEEKEYKHTITLVEKELVVSENCKFCGDKAANAELNICSHKLCDECFGMAQVGGNTCLVEGCEKPFSQVKNIKTGQVMKFE
jgi:hypothetical protein